MNNNFPSFYEVSYTNDSNKKVNIDYSSRVSQNCNKNIVKTLQRNNDSRYTKQRGKNSNNFKYNIDNSMFDIIDTEEKAYFLGWIATAGIITNNKLKLGIHKKDKDRIILEKLRDIVSNDIPIKLYKNYLLYFEVCSSHISEKISIHLGCPSGNKPYKVCFPSLESEILSWAFIRGLFDADGSIRKPTYNRSPECCISSVSELMKEGISNFCNIPNIINDVKIVFRSTNALDFLSNIYDISKPNLRLQRKYDQYVQLINWSASFHGLYGKIPNCKFSKTIKEAVSPSKIRASDEGYDLTIIQKCKQISNNTALYDTGIKVKPEFGYYFDIVPRSSLSKSGYILSNSIGIIDRSYCGSIKVALTKIDNTLPDLELPYRCAQLILRKSNHFLLEEEEKFEDTNRGEGGFGSTN